MKRFLLVLITITALVILPGFNVSAQKKGVLNLYNFLDYIPKDIIQEFEREYNVKVNEKKYKSNEEMWDELLKLGAKGKAYDGGKKYDIVIPAGDYAVAMKGLQMLEKINKNSIPNLKNIDSKIASNMTHDPDFDYLIPYMVSGVGVVVNKKFLTDYQRNMDLFLRPDLKNKIVFLDNLRGVIGLAQLKLGYSVNSVDQNELNKSKNLILDWKKNMRGWGNKSYSKALATGDIWVAVGIPEDIFSEMSRLEKRDMDFFVPQEGAPMYMNLFVIPKGSSNLEEAHKFINFILTPKIYVRIADALGSPGVTRLISTLRTVKPLYSLDDIKNNSFIDYVPNELFTQLYMPLWESVKK